jgi:GNAT superfamily N-acetyltransferase
MLIINTRPEDLEMIRKLFDLAIEYQRSKTDNAWHGMNEPLIRKEIDTGLHWKIMEDDQIACFFSVAFNDPLIWEERDTDPSIYLHRIVTNPAFRGKGYVRHIVAWAEALGRETGRHFIRLDTYIGNEKLNAYYLECGFDRCGSKTFRDDQGGMVPKHYLGPGGLSLFEKRINGLFNAL